MKLTVALAALLGVAAAMDHMDHGDHHDGHHSEEHWSVEEWVEAMQLGIDNEMWEDVKEHCEMTTYPNQIDACYQVIYENDLSWDIMMQAWWKNQPMIAMWGWLGSLMAMWYSLTFVMINDAVPKAEDAEHWFFEVSFVEGAYRWMMFQTWNWVKPEAFLLTQLVSGFTSDLAELELGYQSQWAAWFYMTMAAFYLPFTNVIALTWFALTWWLYCIFWLLDFIDWIVALFTPGEGYYDPEFIKMLNKTRF